MTEGTRATLILYLFKADRSSSLILIAFIGQALKHSPQSIHLSGYKTALPFLTRNA